MVIVKLRTNDGVEVAVDRTIIRKSNMVIGALDVLVACENIGADPKKLANIREVYENVEPIEMRLVNKATYDNVIIWCDQHKNESDQIDEDNLELPKWDVDFFDQLSNRALLDLLISANYLEIAKLRLQISIKLRDKVRGVGPEDIRRIFAK